MSIAAVVMAAGASTRLGRPKQTVELNGETLLARAVRTAREAGLKPVFVVVADTAVAEAAGVRGAIILTNRKPSEGIASSIRLGVKEAVARHAEGIVLMTCDQVAVTAAHLQQLCESPRGSAGSGYAGKTGVPAYFPKGLFPALLRLKGDTGASGLLHHARAVPTEALAFDIDTEADLARAHDFLSSPHEAPESPNTA